ncbi:hypothetical protein JB92DRAFT_376950 [Gautieria morchelliformis]|nr:hypothetical protein JB92DRAFT_376950 [Gautieria morchelliformis]
MDIAVTMASRDARPRVKFMSFLLWGLGTPEKYVRSEELLSTMRPRGISLVGDHLRLVSTGQRAGGVQAIKVLAAAAPPPPSHWLDSPKISHEVLALWRKPFVDQVKIVLRLVPSDAEFSARGNSQFTSVGSRV